MLIFRRHAIRKAQLIKERKDHAATKGHLRELQEQQADALAEAFRRGVKVGMQIAAIPEPPLVIERTVHDFPRPRGCDPAPRHLSAVPDQAAATGPSPGPSAA